MKNLKEMEDSIIVHELENFRSMQYNAGNCTDFLTFILRLLKTYQPKIDMELSDILSLIVKEFHNWNKECETAWSGDYQLTSVLLNRLATKYKTIEKVEYYDNLIKQGKNNK